MKFFKFVSITALVLLSACSSAPTSPEREILYNIGARQAVFRYIASAATPIDQRNRAQRVKQVALGLQSLVDVDAAAVTLPELRRAAEAEILQADLSIPDKDLLLSLVYGLEAYLQQRIADGVLDPTARATVSQVLSWISDAAAAYPLVVEFEG